MKYIIEPVAELNGEGNGWDIVPEAKAKHWRIIEVDGPHEMAIHGCDSRKEAEDWIEETSAYNETFSPPSRA